MLPGVQRTQQPTIDGSGGGDGRQGKESHNDSGWRTPKSDAKRIPKETNATSSRRISCHNDKDLNYLNGFEDFGWTL